MSPKKTFGEMQGVLDGGSDSVSPKARDEGAQ